MFDIKKFITEGSTGPARQMELEAHKIEGAMRTLASSLQRLESQAGKSPISQDVRALRLQTMQLAKGVKRMVDRIETEHREN